MLFRSTIDPSEMQGLSVSFAYTNRNGRQELLTIGLSLQTPVSNAQARESILNIKQRAPTRYYSQNRMVNGEDYNNFPYTLYSSIIKSKAINRSSVGISKNLDLTDPTGKYSSIDCVATDGAMYSDSTNGYDLLQIFNSVDIISYLSNNLSNTLAAIRANQYYVQNYPRYLVDTDSGDGTVYWNLSSVNTNSNTGYVYNLQGVTEVPVSVGTYNANNLKYLTKGAMLKFTAPPGYYFDTTNRLVSGVPGASDITYVWCTVLNVVGDGYNNGLGDFSNGSGPITLNVYIPQGAVLSQIIPTFSNKLPNSVLQEAVTRMELNQNFSLVFDNSLAINEDRWKIDIYTTNNWFVKFECTATNRYTVTYRSLAY